MSQTVLQNDRTDVYVDVSGVYGNLFIGVTDDRKTGKDQLQQQQIKPKTITLKSLDFDALIGKQPNQNNDFSQQKISLLPTSHLWFEVGSLNPELAEDFVLKLMKSSGSRLSYSRQLQQRLETEETKVFKLMSCFQQRAADASDSLNLCQTLIKKYCRQCGMPRWPQRKIRALDTSIEQSEKVLKKLPNDPESYNQQHQISLRKYEDTLELKHMIYDQFLANYYAREFEFRRGGREKFRQKRLENEQRLQMLRQQSYQQDQIKEKQQEKEKQQYEQEQEEFDQQQEEDCSFLLDDLIDINNFTDLLVPFGDWSQQVGEKRKR